MKTSIKWLSKESESYHYAIVQTSSKEEIEYRCGGVAESLTVVVVAAASVIKITNGRVLNIGQIH